MTTALCPSCGAPITFRFSSAVQTVCPYCRSILVREDVDLRRVGQVADLPDDPSPVQIGTEGVYRNKSFTVVGRILYRYDLGTWNEWHIVFSDGTSGWLSDAQLEYAITFLTEPGAPLPRREETHRGEKLRWQNVEYEVTVQTLARYSGVEGELPFTYWGKNAVWFLDLRTTDARFATIDYSEATPWLFTGESVSLDSLRLTNLRTFEGWS